LASASEGDTPSDGRLAHAICAEVFDDHLRRANEGDVEGDIETNYAEDVAFIDNGIVRIGRQGAREAAARLEADAPDATYAYVTVLVEGEIAYLEWTAKAHGVRIEIGVDSFVIRDGLIRAQTIYYRVADG
jgi:hypothetical protein